MKSFFKRNFIYNPSVDHSASTHWTYIILLGLFLILPFFITQTTDQSGGSSLRLWKIPLPGMCLSRSIFGVRCPGCGLTRSFVALAHGEWRQAFSYHRIGPVLYFYFLLLIFFHLYGLLKKNQPLPRILLRAHQITALAIIAALIINWILLCI
ncbi:DUF2752 domain-containing protein [Candidatus Sumerlaeota bacterium]|nr:DUF2752 domain-containing protein [Candidatus Sumerlaeota bacterium]